MKKVKQKKKEKETRLKLRPQHCFKRSVKLGENANNKGDYFAFSKVSATFMATEMLANAAV